MCPNFRKFQVLPGISHLNSVEWFLWKNSIIWEFKAEWKTLLVLQIPNCGHLSKITILKWGIVFFPCLHAVVRVPARVFLSHRRCKASHITCNVTSEKWQEYSKILSVFYVPKLFYPCSPVHSSDKTILCVLSASLAYKERAMRVTLMMENRICYKQNFRTNFKNGKVQRTSSQDVGLHCNAN